MYVGQLAASKWRRHQHKLPGEREACTGGAPPEINKPTANQKDTAPLIDHPLPIALTIGFDRSYKVITKSLKNNNNAINNSIALAECRDDTQVFAF